MIKDLVETLYFLGLKQDDAVFIHSDVTNFKFFKPKHNLFIKKKFFFLFF